MADFTNTAPGNIHFQTKPHRQSVKVRCVRTHPNSTIMGVLSCRNDGDRTVPLYSTLGKNRSKILVTNDIAVVFNKSQGRVRCFELIRKSIKINQVSDIWRHAPLVYQQGQSRMLAPFKTMETWQPSAVTFLHRLLMLQFGYTTDHQFGGNIETWLPIDVWGLVLEYLTDTNMTLDAKPQRELCTDYVELKRLIRCID
jgi:hypothetical protein